MPHRSTARPKQRHCHRTVVGRQERDQRGRRAGGLKRLDAGHPDGAGHARAERFEPVTRAIVERRTSPCDQIDDLPPGRLCRHAGIDVARQYRFETVVEPHLIRLHVAAKIRAVSWAISSAVPV